MSKTVELFSGDAQGTLQGTIYRKQIVRFGNWVDPFDPQDTMVLDEALAKKFQKNFLGKVIDRVPVPLNHTDDVSANTGELIKLEIASDGIYGYLDIRDGQTVQDIENGLVFDVSISFDWDYIDTETGKHWGPTLLHVALVNNPYLVHMKGFEQVADAAGSFANQIKTALGLAQKSNTGAIMLSESKVKELRAMKLSKITNDREFEVTIKVKGDDGVEVDKLLKVGEEVEVPEDQLENVKVQITDAVDPNAEEEEDADEDEDEEEDENKGKDGKDKLSRELSRANAKLAKMETEKLYGELLSRGKITPAQKDRFMALANENSGAKVTTLSKDGKKVQVTLAKAVANVLNAGPVIAKLNNEDGSGKGGDADEQEDKDTNKKPSERLNEQESKGLQAVGASPERMDELSKKYPDMKSTLDKIDQNKGDK